MCHGSIIIINWWHNKHKDNASCIFIPVRNVASLSTCSLDSDVINVQHVNISDPRNNMGSGGEVQRKVQFCCACATRIQIKGLWSLWELWWNSI